MLHDLRGRVGYEAVYDDAFRHGAQPGKLAFGELACGGDAFVTQGFAVVVSVKVLPSLAITYAAHGGHAQVQVATLAQSADFFNQRIVFEHLVESQCDAFVQFAAVGWFQRERYQLKGQVCLFFARMQGGQGFSGQFDDFQCALDSLGVVRFEPLCGFRVQFGQSGMQGWPSGLCGFFIQSGTDGRVGFGEVVQSFCQRVEIQHGAADEQRQFSALYDALNEREGVFAKLCCRIGIGRVNDVDEVVRNGGLFFAGWFCGADVHVTIDEGGINGDDFAWDMAGDFERGGGFSGSCRSHDGDDRGFCILHVVCDAATEQVLPCCF